MAFILYCAIALVGTVNAQTLTIKGKVQLEGAYTLEKVDVAIVNLNDTGATPERMHIIKNFSSALPFNGEYLVIVSRAGYQPKAIYINTFCDSTKPFKYLFEVDLQPKDVQDNIPMHAGGIYWNKKKGIFDYYLTN